MAAVPTEARFAVVARKGRLVRENSTGPRRVRLSPVDETALRLVSALRRRGGTLHIVYPAPANDVAVLLAAELLVDEFARIGRRSSFTVGLLTADPAGAARVWAELRVTNVGDRVPVSDVFVLHRVFPDGRPPGDARRSGGLVLGDEFCGWPVDVLVVNRMAAWVRTDGIPESVPVVTLYADPLDPELERAQGSGGLVWGWSRSDLALTHAEQEPREATAPFSVAEARLRVLAGGVNVDVLVLRDDAVEKALERVADDILLLGSMARTDPRLQRGVRVAWRHFVNLASLPCRPSAFDVYSGLPPFASRSVASYEKEIAAWARTLSGDAQEIGYILADDLAALRSSLEERSPTERALRELTKDHEGTLLLRSRTAARALAQQLGRDPNAEYVGRTGLATFSRSVDEPPTNHVLVVGPLHPWEWHLLDSGAAPNVTILVLGSRQGERTRRALVALRAARRRWASTDVRGRTWLTLFGEPLPGVFREDPAVESPAELVHYQGEIEPDVFGPLRPLLSERPLDFSDVDPHETLARSDADGQWSAVVDAVEVQTNRGTVLLEVGRPVEVRRGERIHDVYPESLVPGDVLLVGKREGRLGLLDALEARNTMLRIARMVVTDYRRRVQAAFETRGVSHGELHRMLGALGSRRSGAAVRAWISEDGVLAPRDFADLRRLNIALGLGLSETRMREIYSAVQRIRGFRRAAGRALARVAARSTVLEESIVDAELGLSPADLRDAILQASVVCVRHLEHPIPVAELARLREG